MAATVARPRVFLDVNIGEEPAGRLVIELFSDKAPKTCGNFRALCTGSKPPLTYKMSSFHRIIDEFMVQGGDITKGDGTGGDSIYGGEFEDENVGWREIDAAGLVCMANRGKDTNSSQFFITLAPCPHLNAKHTVFGHLVSGQSTLDRLAKVPVDKNDKPTSPVLIAHCGELERRKKAPTAAALAPPSRTNTDTSASRGRRKRRRSGSPSRSPSPSRGHHRRSASRHRHRHRKSRPSRSVSASRSRSRSPSQLRAKYRRRSDALPDETLRGRPRQRSRSHTRSPPQTGTSPPPRHRRKRSTPPSRSPSPERRRSRDRDRERDVEMEEKRSNSPGFRRQRSLPNQYRQYARDGGGWRDGRYLDRAGERMRDPRGDEGRLGGGDGDAGVDGGGIIYKGRGSMKYRERRW